MASILSGCEGLQVDSNTTRSSVKYPEYKQIHVVEYNSIRI